jgi:cytochrome c
MALPLMLAATAASGVDKSASVRAGKELVTRNCASCHAIDHASPLKQAPPFRVVVRRYPPTALEEALAEGISTGHPEMPEFVFKTPQIAAIVAYLNSLRAKLR